MDYVAPFSWIRWLRHHGIFNLDKNSILQTRIAVDVFGLHLREPDASGSFFLNIKIFGLAEVRIIQVDLF